MSSRRPRSNESRITGSTITDDQIADLVSKLQQLIPQIRHRRSSSAAHDKVSASRVLEETCNYIRSLNKEMDGLSERLSELLASTNDNTVQAAIIRSLLM